MPTGPDRDPSPDALDPSAEGSVADKAAKQQRGRPFGKGRSGNPAGRPKGSRHRATLLAEALLDGEAERLTRKAVDLALEGDGVALRLCLERLVPPRRERTLRLKLPPVASPAELPAAMTVVLAAAVGGELTPGEARALTELIEACRRMHETCELAERLAALEERVRDDDAKPDVAG